MRYRRRRGLWTPAAPLVIPAGRRHYTGQFFPGQPLQYGAGQFSHPGAVVQTETPRPEIFGTPSSNHSESDADATITVAHTVAVGAQLVLVRTHGWGSSTSTGFPVTSVIWTPTGESGEALSRAAKGSGTRPDRPSTEIWYRVGPTAGAGVITVTFNHRAGRDPHLCAPDFDGADGVVIVEDALTAPCAAGVYNL